MQIVTIIVLTILFGLLVLNAAVTVVLLRAVQRYSLGQRLVQVALIWLLPFVGGMLVWSFLHDAKPAKSERVEAIDSLGIGSSNLSINGNISGVEQGGHGDISNN